MGESGKGFVLVVNHKEPGMVKKIQTALKEKGEDNLQYFEGMKIKQEDQSYLYFAVIKIKL